MPELEIIDSHLPMVAIVGRPNVGKSTFFNRVIGRRKAVVLDTPGITRDRIFERGEWNGRHFMLVDTGGYETEPRDSTFRQMREQSLIAVQEADVVLFMTEVMDPDNPEDLDVADILRRSGKPKILVINKCDNKKRREESYSFYALGFKNQYAIGALSGSGVADLLDKVVKLLPPKQIVEAGAAAQEGIRIAVIGRPNVGKSSIVNALLGRERVIVNELPGTTRDAIDTTFRLKGDGEGKEDRVYTLIDTAGLRRPGKQGRGVEKLSALFAGACLNRCDVALVLIDAKDGLTEQDQHVVGYAHEAFRPTILLVNKWDLIEKDSQTAGEFVKKLRHEMGHVGYAPILMTSAKTGQRVHKITDLVDRVYASSKKVVETARLNEWLEKTTRRLSPPWHKGKQLRIKYVTQVGSHPPTFVFFVNNPKLIHFSYERYLINRLRESFGFEGTPIRIKLKRKSTKRASDMISYTDD